MMTEEHRLHGGLGTSPEDRSVDIKRKCEDFTALYPMDTPASVTNGASLSGVSSPSLLGLSGHVSSHSGLHGGGPHGISPITGPAQPRSLSDQNGKYPCMAGVWAVVWARVYKQGTHCIVFYYIYFFGYLGPWFNYFIQTWSHCNVKVAEMFSILISAP